MSFLNFGYYIVEVVPKPNCISLNCAQVLSVSECICNFHPSLNGSFWLKHDKDQLNYQSKLRITDDDFNTMKITVNDLFNSQKIDFDSRFNDYTDSLNFYKKYLHNLNNLKIIAVALDDEFKRAFCDEIENRTNIQSVLEVPQLSGNLLGYEILGWDNSSFHSYLCNGLEKDIYKKYQLEINHLGIIQNSYDEVKEFAKHIDGKGEPVTWLPFAIYEYPTK